MLLLRLLRIGIGSILNSYVRLGQNDLPIESSYGYAAPSVLPVVDNGCSNPVDPNARPMMGKK